MSRTATCAHRVWIVAPHQVRRYAAQLSQLQAWCYLGTRLEQRDKLARILPSSRRRNIGNELNVIAKELVQPFADWVASIGVQQRNPRRWWASRVASRSPFQTDLFLLVCYAELIRRWLSEDAPRACAVVVDDPWLRAVLTQALRSDTRVRLMNRGWAGCVRQVFLEALRIPSRRMYRLVGGLLSMGVARWHFPDADQAIEAGQDRLILLYSWIFPQSFSTSGQFHDPYTGRLEQLLREHGSSIRRLTPLDIGIRSGLWSQLRRLASGCVIAPRYVRVRDVVRASAAWFAIDHMGRVSRFLGWDYGALLRREMLREWSDGEFVGYQLWYWAMRRLATRHGARISVVIYPFENHPWEKLLCLAFQHEAPNVQLVGYQHSWVSPDLLNYRLGRDEATVMPLPHRIVANGVRAVEMLTAGGVPTEKLCNGGAFRYEYLYEQSDTVVARRPRSRVEGEPWRLVAALPLSPLHGSSLLRALVDIFPTPFLSETQRDPVDVIVKCHPLLPLHKLQKRSVQLPEWFRVTEQPLRELCKTADVFVYAPPSTSGWEAAVMGLPVVRYRDEWLDMEPSEEESLEVAVGSTEALRRTLTGLLAQHATRSEPLVRHDILRQCFSPIDERIWIDLTQREHPESRERACVS